jgi:hypothetical protein
VGADVGSHHRGDLGTVSAFRRHYILEPLG